MPQTRVEMQEILQDLPHLLAVKVDILLKAHDGQSQALASMSVFEQTLRLLTIIMSSQYLRWNAEAISDSDLNRAIVERFDQRYLHEWLELLLTALRAYMRFPDRLFVPELHEFYWDVASPQGLCERREVEQGLRRLMAWHTDLQNHRKWPVDATGWAMLASQIQVEVNSLLKRLKFLANYELIRIVEAVGTCYVAEVLRGLQVTRVSFEAETDPLQKHWFYLTRDRRRFLLLDPFLVWWESEPPEIGLFGGKWDHKLRYLPLREEQPRLDGSQFEDFVALIDTITEFKEKLWTREAITWGRLRDAAWQISRHNIGDRAPLHFADVYCQRQDLLHAFEAFLSSSYGCFLLTGKSGSGKSSFVLSLLEEYTHVDSLCLLAIDAAQISPGSRLTEYVGGEFCRQWGWSSEGLSDIWVEIDRLPEMKDRQVVLIVDAINENNRPSILLQQVNHLIGDKPWLKVVLASRPEAWLRMWRDTPLKESLFFTSESSSGVGASERPPLSAWDLKPFSWEELPGVYARYRAEFDLKTAYDALPAGTLKLIREPLYLWMIANTYSKQAIASALRPDRLVDDYLQALLDTKRIYPEDRTLLKRDLIPLLEPLPGLYTNRITEETLENAPDLHRQIFDAGPYTDGLRVNASFQRLVDAQILISHSLKSPPSVELKHDYIYDHFFGQHLFEKHIRSKKDRQAACHSLIASVGTFPPMWGAVKRALYLGFCSSPELAQDLAFSDSQDVAYLVNSALQDLAVCEPEKALSVFRWTASRCIRRQVFRSRRPAWLAAEMALEGAGTLGDQETFLTLLAAREATLNEMAVDRTYLWGRESPDKALDVAVTLSERITKPRWRLDRHALKSAVFLFPLLAIDCWRQEGLHSTKLDRLLAICRDTVERIDRHPSSRILQGLVHGSLASSAMWAAARLLTENMAVGSMNNIPLYRLFFQRPREMRDRARDALVFIDHSQSSLSDLVDLLRDLYGSCDQLSEQIADYIVMSHGIHVPSEAESVLWELLDTVHDPDHDMDIRACSCWCECASRQKPVTEEALKTMAALVSRSLDSSKNGYGIVVREGRAYPFLPLHYYMKLWARVFPTKPVDLADYYLTRAMDRHDEALLLHVIDSYGLVIDLTSHCSGMLRSLEPYVHATGAVREHLAGSLVALRELQPVLVDRFLLEADAPSALLEEIRGKTRERPRRWHYLGLFWLLQDFLAYAPSPLLQHALAVCQDAMAASSLEQAAPILANGLLDLLSSR